MQQRLHVIGEKRREHEQAPHAVDDRRNRRQQLDGGAERPLERNRAHLGQEQRDAEAHRDADQRARSPMSPACRRSAPARRTRCVTGFQTLVTKNAETELLQRRQRRVASATMIDSSSASTSAANNRVACWNSASCQRPADARRACAANRRSASRAKVEDMGNAEASKRTS